MSARRLGLVALIVGVQLACGGSEPPPAAPADAPSAPPAEALGDLDPSTLAGEADKKYALVPSPLETQATLVSAGIEAGLVGLVPADRGFDLAAADADRVAVRTGVVLADLMLTANTADAAATAARIAQVRGGLKTLGAKPDLLGALEELERRVENGAVGGDALVKELDELAGALIPRAEAQLGGRIVPMIRAGSWVEGTNLVSGALVEAGRYEAATELLRQPAVVGYFRGWVSGEGAAVAPTEILPKLEAALVTLDGVCQKERFGEAEVRLILDTTDTILALL